MGILLVLRTFFALFAISWVSRDGIFTNSFWTALLKYLNLQFQSNSCLRFSLSLFALFESSLDSPSSSVFAHVSYFTLLVGCGALGTSRTSRMLAASATRPLAWVACCCTMTHTASRCVHEGYRWVSFPDTALYLSLFYIQKISFSVY